MEVCSMGGVSFSAILAGLAIWLGAIASVAGRSGTLEQGAAGRAIPLPTPDFLTSDNCLACHNSLTTPSGEDVSIGHAWRGSIMANSARDPYWQASVRRETLDHPAQARVIEDECATCHMPMARTRARSRNAEGRVFQHLPISSARSEESRLASDGVSCTLCHQISGERLGTKESFTGGFVVGPTTGAGATIFGPFHVAAGQARLMHSATGVTPAEGRHIQESALCATCHTLYTNARGPSGEVVGSLPEQVPYLEWQHSAYRDERSCQSCHMPDVSQPTPVASVLGDPRPGLSRHTFVGGNVFMLRMLNRYRADLGVDALPSELEANARATIVQLVSNTAVLSATASRAPDGVLAVEVAVRNLTGHKFPTGYPSRRSWLHVAVRDERQRVVFESGAVQASGAIAGNDNDADASTYEPHYDEIRSPDQVQIYESVMVDSSGKVTTGLLRGLRFAKDNRLLPRGFDKAKAAVDIAVHGEAAMDSNFDADGDRVRYRIPLGGVTGSLTIDLALRYQSISFRWARNLASYDADEPRRFVSYFDAMADQSSTVVASTVLQVR
jgi:hypothetical protein